MSQTDRTLPVALIGLASIAAVWWASKPSSVAQYLPPLAAQMEATSTSGISSGAYMAGQFEFAHSKIVIGTAIIAGGPYGCAESAFAGMMPGPGAAFFNLSKAVNGCMLNTLMPFGVPDPEALADKARRRAEDTEIDPIADVVADRVYLFTGSEDRTVVPPIVREAERFYRAVGVPEANIKFEQGIAAGHAFITLDQGLACAKSGEPYIVDCDYDQAGALLSHIYGDLKPKSAAAAGSYISFDQRPFIRDLPNNGMSDQGVVYVPSSCLQRVSCRIHVAFHGCAQNRDRVGDAFVSRTGFARWADTNEIIVLFPQTGTTAFNPQGCWDWWGYTGRDYLSSNAPQIKAVYRMLERLSAPRSTLESTS